MVALLSHCWVCVRVVARTTVITTSRLTMMNGSQVLRKPPQLKKEGRYVYVCVCVWGGVYSREIASQLRQNSALCM